MSTTDVILETRGLTKEFKGFVAVDNVNLKVQRGTIHALIGPNGAGKTTCFNLLTKFLTPTRGQIFFNGTDITARLAGARRTPRHRSVVSDFVGVSTSDSAGKRANRIAARHESIISLLAQRAVLHSMNARALALLNQVDLGSFANDETVSLPYGRKRALEIATTLATEPELMLLDEPTQGMGHEDVARVTDLIKRVAAGRTVMMVEHNMSVVAGISDQHHRTCSRRVCWLRGRTSRCRTILPSRKPIWARPRRSWKGIGH